MGTVRLGVLCFVMALMSMGACGGDDPASSETENQAAPESSEAPEAVEPDDEDTAGGIPQTSVGRLSAGRYQTAEFEPTATFKVGKGWRVAEEDGQYILLLRKPQPNDEAIYIDSSQGDASVDKALNYVQESFVATTGSKRDFKFSPTVPVGIGDYHGSGVTMQLLAKQLVVTLALGTEAYEVHPNDKLHLNAIDVDGETVIIFVEASGSRFESFLKEAEPVLASLDF